MNKIFSICAILFVTVFQAVAQEGEGGVKKWLEKNERFKPQVKAMVQLWTTYSNGYEVYNEEANSYEAVDDRFNVFLRRARLVVSGEPYRNLKYTLVLFYDGAGKDLLSSTNGPSNPANPNAGIWDAFFQWKMGKNESLNLIGGWFRPQMQRDNITSAWTSNSFEKPMSQNYVRRLMTGTGPGRAAGLNFGGLLQKDRLNLNYNAGVFNPLETGLDGRSVGRTFSPLFAGRLSLSIGDPEMEKYGIGYKVNYFGERNGVSLDLNASTQGETELFESSFAWGPGILLNWGPVNFDAEWIWMQRDGTGSLPDGTSQTFTATSGVGHARAGVNLTTGRFVLEPMFMVMHFAGATDAEGQLNAKNTGMFSGRTNTYDAGLNWYLDGNNLRIMLHYTWHTGDSGDAGDGATVNQFFSQSGVGAIRRGDYLGLGVNAIF